MNTTPRPVVKIKEPKSAQEITLHIPDEFNHVCVNVSGGADSAILLYMVADYIKQFSLDVKLSVNTCSNDAKGHWNAIKAADICNYVRHATGIDIELHYVFYRDKQDASYFHELNHKLLSSNMVDSFISGITSNPKINDSVEDINGNMTPLWKDAMPSRHVDNEPTISGAHMQPMINVDKRMVAYLYDMYGVNDLLNLTRSCEELPGDKLTASELELFKKTPCGMCWWCLERKWAFGKF